MDAVTIELDEEVMKHNSSTEQLPEPLLIILSPPPPFLPVPSEPAISWDRWHRLFEQYLEALGETELIDSTKCVLLQNCLGQEGQRVYKALIQGEATYAAATSALSVHFSSGNNLQTCRLKFHQRAQRLGETVEQFVCALQELGKSCNFGDAQDKLILNQLVEKTNCTQLQERLLAEKDTLTLANALVIGKQIEYASTESAALGFQKVTVDDADRPAQRGRPGRRKNLKPHATITASNPSGHKNNDDYFYGNDKHYYSSSGEHDCDGGDETDPDYDDADDKGYDDDGDEVKDEGCDKPEDYDVGGDDKEEVMCKTKTKGHFCPVCIDRNFRNANKLARHMKTHTKEKPFSCPVCAVTFSQSYHMTRHIKNQHGAGQHICSTCGESLRSWAELKTHKKTHSAEVLPCHDCDKKFKKKSVLLNHIKSHSKEHLNRSRYCDGLTNQESQNKSNYYSDEKHYGGDEKETDDWHDFDGREQTDAHFGNDAKDKGSEVAGDEMEAKYYDGAKEKLVLANTKTKGHFCPICVDRSFRGANKLARHMRTHTKEKPFSCPVCAVTFSQSYHMTRHIRNQHGLGQYICAKCGEGFSSWVELKTHKKTHAAEVLSRPVGNEKFEEKSVLSRIKSHSKVQLNTQRPVCTECGKIFTRMYHLKRHMATHGIKTQSLCYKCPDCQRSYSLLKDLNKHLEIHRKEKNGTCLKCDRTFSCPDELEAHMEIHEKSYLCTICGKKFKVEYALKKHEQGHKEEQFYCSLCDKQFSKLSHYKRHLMVHDKRESKCPHCESVFLQLTALKNHLRTHTEERPYQCPCCVESFTKKEELEQHCLKHRKFKKEKPYSCSRCAYAFSSLTELTAHMRSHKGEQPMNCPDCGKTFLNKAKLEKHLSIHTGERPHLCSICGNGFPSAAGLKLHVHIHTGDKPFKCSHCSKSFASSSGLRLHSRHHMAVRPSYPCPDCGRIYGRVTELKMHQRYHTGDKPYSCTCCNKRFVSKDKLNVHMRTHTGERPYSCPHCGQTFTQTGDRNRHMSKYH